ncbi:MAG: FlgD immunoglobulin-like domain containing protein [Candidatus Latescibacter sp.]|nr:FlgD immunoglobulin-like domain containing protein [Candidatus Latescibacter sp.]
MFRSKYFAGILLIGSLCFFGNLSSASDFGTQLTYDRGSKFFTDWSPDGKWIAYGRSGDIWYVPSTGGAPINITANINESCGFPSFTADSKEICFDHHSIYDNSWNLLTNILAKINIYTGEYSLILDNAVHTAWSHNGRYLAYQELGTADWYVLDTVNNKTRFLADGATEVVLYGPNRYTLSCFTPDDKYIITTMNYFTDNGGHSLGLFKIPVMGGEREQLTSHEVYHQWYPDCSPDGEWILYTNFLKSDYGQREIYTYNTLSEVSMPVFPELTSQHWCASFSPDGTKFCYLKFGINSNSLEVFVANFPFQSQVVPAINKLIEEVNELVASWDLDKGIGNALISKLNESVKAINKGNSNSAINQLEAFINQVEALRGKKLSTDQANEYIGTIRKVINVLSKQAELAKINVPANKSAKKEIVIADPYSLKQNSPNPFNPSTTISFTVSSVNNETVLLNIYDIRGSLIRNLIYESKAPGVYSVVWDGKDGSGGKVSAGIYFCRMQAGQFSKTNKMILMK